MADNPLSIIGTPSVSSYTALKPLPPAQTQDYSALSQGPSNFLFNRAYTFTIGTPGYGGVSYNALRIAFEVEKTSSSSANKAKIIIYNSNLSLQSSADFKGKEMVLRAGYGFPDKVTGIVPNLPVIFASGLSATAKIINNRKNGDVTTEFQVMDSQINIQNSVYDQSYPRLTPYFLVVNDIISAMGLVPYIYDPSQVLKSTFLPGSRVVSGAAQHSLTILLAQIGFQWNVDSTSGFGTAQVYPKGSSLTANPVLAAVVSQSTGLIGVPNQSNAEGGIVEFTALMNANLAPGRLVKLKAATVSGNYIIRNAKIEGDSHGNKWQVTCQCLPPSVAGFSVSGLIQGVDSDDTSLSGATA